MDGQTKKGKILSRRASLMNERSSWDPHWREISSNLLPRSGRFFTSDRNRGDKRHNQIYDNTGPRALRTLAAGMMAGMTSPARPWFRLTTSDPQLDESAAVKTWLANVQRLMQMIFAKSNTYRALHASYEELGAFGTASTLVLPNFKNIIHHYPLTTGEFYLATNAEGVVDTICRNYQMTVGQMVGQFGRNNVSETIRTLADRPGSVDSWVDVVQMIQPRQERDTRMKDAANMPFMSAYYELGGNEDKPLRNSGFKSFPGLCPRWATTGGDIYGSSPGMEALGDLKQLQHEQLRKAQGIDYKTRPPLQGPSSLKGHEVDGLPGGFTMVDAASPQGGVRTLFESNIDLSHLLEDIRDVRERVKGSFYADLFLMLANGTNPAMTATEVAERHEEKLLMLGPVLERMHNEILDPLIEMTFQRIVEAGLLVGDLAPPDELQGVELNVEFVSMLAQAQRAIATNSVDRFVGALGQVAAIKPEVLDRLDADEWVDAYADMLGVDPKLIVPGEQAALIRQQRAEAQAKQAQAEQIQQAADAAQKLGSVNTAQPNALTDVTRAFSGYT